MPRSEGSAPGTVGPSTVQQLVGRLDLEQQVWRVEASPGRMHGTGVYDLACTPHRSGQPADDWRLVRVAD